MKNIFRPAALSALCIIASLTNSFSQSSDSRDCIPDPPGIKQGMNVTKYLDENGAPLANGPGSSRSTEPEGDAFQEYSFSGAAAVDYYGFSVASAGDVNGDGYSDIVIGAPFNDAGGTDAGRVYVYYGGQIIDYNADVILTGTVAGGKLGFSVSSAGDVNADGYADVIAGAIAVSSNDGRAYIYLGGSPMNNTADVTLQGQGAGELFGISVSHAGDLNGDSYSDVVVGAYANSGYNGKAYAFFGSAVMNNSIDLTFFGAEPVTGFGYAVSSAGDFNGDGYSDIIIGEGFVGASLYGKALLFLGSANMDNGPDLIITGATYADYFGSSLAYAGDVNGDGFSDVIIGAYQHNSQTGAAYIYYGGSVLNSVADVAMYGVSGADFFGVSVGGDFDVNGDGFKDVIVGARQNDNGGTNTGCAYIYYGGTSVNSVPDAVLSAGIPNDQFGFCVASAGDVNRDGMGDIIVGVPYNDQNGADAGKAWLYTNTRNRTPLPIASFSGPGGFDYFGLKCSDAGDLNGDGYGDVMANSINYEQVYVYFGGQSLANSAGLIIYAPNGPESFSNSISSAGDLNSDGYDDIIIGAEGGNSATGRAYIYFGSASMDNIPDLILSGFTPNNYFGSAVASAGDVNGDSYDDVIVGARGVGAAYIFYGGATMNNVSDVTLTGNLGAFGISVAGIGSVNGDIYDDVIVGAPYEGANSEGKAYLFLGGSSMNNVVDQTFTGAGVNAKKGSAVSAAGDVNSDGYDDVLIGGLTPSFLIPDSKGRVELYLGSPAIDAVADVTMIGLDVNYQLGGSIADIGDYNKDGYGDFAVTSNPAKRVYIHFGSASPDNVPDLVLAGEDVNTNIYFGMSVSFAGDVNGDGNTDIIASGYGLSSQGSAYIFTYTRSYTDLHDAVFDGEAAGDWMGYAVASAGDVNSDGFADVIVGARLNDAAGTDAGRAYIYFGGNPMDFIPDVILNGLAPGDQFGFSVAGTGDVNGDGYGDVIVGAPLNDAAGSNAGRAYIFYGGASMNNVADVILTGEFADNQFGFRVAGAGNFNGDNIGDIWQDVIVGSPYNDAGGSHAGRAYIYFGSPSMNNVVDVVFTGAASSYNLGVSVASAGDVNGDSFGDIIIGASGSDAFATDAGQAFILFGSPFPDNIADLTFNGSAAGDWFGYSTASAGDANGDGFGDVVIGAFRNDQNGTDAGRAYFYYGGLPMNNTADMNYYGESSNDWFGICVASAGDVSGDGRPDLIIGSSYNDAGGTDAGRAYVYFSSSNINNNPDIVLTGRTGEYFGWFLSGAGDVNADGQSDLLVGAYQSSVTSPQNGRGYLFISSHPENHLILKLKTVLQAFYDPSSETLNKQDTLTVNLHNASYPYAIAGSAKAVVSKLSFTARFYFKNVAPGNYWIDVRHRNSIETWSSGYMEFKRNIATEYDMAVQQNRAYMNNTVLVDNSPVRYAIYSGDVNQDGIVDATDALLIDNDANNFAAGYLDTDVNGDYSVDATDALIVDNNSSNFVSKMVP